MISNHESWCNYVSNNYYNKNGIEISKPAKIHHSLDIQNNTTKDWSQGDYLKEWKVVGKFKNEEV